MAFIRQIKKGNATYLAKVESYREDGKVKQRVLEYVGKKENGLTVVKTDFTHLQVSHVKRYADISVLIQLAQELKLNYLLGKHHKSIIALVIAHLLCKGSIVSISTWAQHTTLYQELGLEPLATRKLYEALDYLNDVCFELLETSLTSQWARLAPKDTASFVLDVTDTYYAGSQTASKARKGKDGKVARLVQIGLIVSFEHGFPIVHKTYEGNISNIKIFSDLLQAMAAKGLSSMIMDRGFYSEENVCDLENLGMKVIIGMKRSVGLQKKYLDAVERDSIYSHNNQITLKETTVYAQAFPFLKGKLIVIYNPKYEVLKRDRMLAEKAATKEIRYIGYSLIYHNTTYSTGEVVKKYFDKDVIERSFKTLKGETQLHPIRLWLPERVEAHVKLCYLSLCLLTFIQFKCRKLELSAAKVLEELQHIYKVNMVHAKTKKTWTKVVSLNNQQKLILKALKCSV